MKAGQPNFSSSRTVPLAGRECRDEETHSIWMSSRTAANGASLLSAAADDDDETLRRESGDEVGAAAATRGAKRTACVANERPPRGSALRVADRANILWVREKDQADERPSEFGSFGWQRRNT